MHPYLSTCILVLGTDGGIDSVVAVVRVSSVVLVPSVVHTVYQKTKS